jgi:glutathione-regulated potassium-efflux system protein KefB
MDIGIEHIFRETFLSSVSMSRRVLIGLGFDSDEVETVAARFRTRDSRLLREQHAFHMSEEKLIQSSRDTAAEFGALLKNDVER